MSKTSSLLKIPSPLLQLFWATLLLAVASCSDGLELSDMPPPETLSNAPAIVQEARKQLQEQGNFHLLNMQGWGARAMRGASSSENTLTAEHVRWEKYHLFKDGEQECAAIPIESGVRTALTVLNTDGRVRKTRNKVTTKLIVNKEPNGRITFLIGTYVYDHNYARDYGDEIAKLGYLLDDTHFTGYFMLSRLRDGSLVFGRCMRNGREYFSFRANPHPRAKGGDTDSGIHLYLGLDGSTRMTRSAQLEEESDDEMICSSCHRPASSCGCAVVTLCRICHENVINGRCGCSRDKCPYCGFPKKECNCCQKCHQNKSQCTCNTPNTEEWSSSSGSSSGDSGGGSSSWAGDGGSGGGNYHGPNPGPPPPPDYSGGGNSNVETPDKKVESPKENIPPTQKTYHIGLSRANSLSSEVVHSIPGSEAMCNVGVYKYVEKAFPGISFPELKGLRANDMVTSLKAHTERWYATRNADEAQKYAQSGFLVIGGWHSGTKSSGHVVIILPKEAGDKSKYPRTMDTGSGMRSNTQHLNDSFRKSRIPQVVYFIFKQ